MDKLIYEEMFRIEETHWWFVARRKIITHLIEKMIPKLNHSKEKILICDLGCGCGAMLKVLSQKYNVYGMEASDDAIKFCRERGLNIQKGELPYDVPYEEKKSRLNRYNELQDKISLEKNQLLINQSVEVLVEGVSKKRTYEMMGRTRTDKVVICKGNESQIGLIINVKIEKSAMHTLFGEDAEVSKKRSLK